MHIRVRGWRRAAMWRGHRRRRSCSFGRDGCLSRRGRAVPASGRCSKLWTKTRALSCCGRILELLPGDGAVAGAGIVDLETAPRPGSLLEGGRRRGGWGRDFWPGDGAPAGSPLESGWRRSGGRETSPQPGSLLEGGLRRWCGQETASARKTEARRGAAARAAQRPCRRLPPSNRRFYAGAMIKAADLCLLWWKRSFHAQGSPRRTRGRLPPE